MLGAAAAPASCMVPTPPQVLPPAAESTGASKRAGKPEQYRCEQCGNTFVYRPQGVRSGLPMQRKGDTVRMYASAAAAKAAHEQHSRLCLATAKVLSSTNLPTTAEPCGAQPEAEQDRGKVQQFVPQDPRLIITDELRKQRFIGIVLGGGVSSSENNSVRKAFIDSADFRDLCGNIPVALSDRQLRAFPVGTVVSFTVGLSKQNTVHAVEVGMVKKHQAASVGDVGAGEHSAPVPPIGHTPPPTTVRPTVGPGAKACSGILLPQSGAPTVMCRNADNCAFVNDSQHQKLFRHICKIPDCGYRHLQWHCDLFDHPEANYNEQLPLPELSAAGMPGILGPYQGVPMQPSAEYAGGTGNFVGTLRCTPLGWEVDSNAVRDVCGCDPIVLPESIGNHCDGSAVSFSLSIGSDGLPQAWVHEAWQGHMMENTQCNVAATAAPAPPPYVSPQEEDTATVSESGADTPVHPVLPLCPKDKVCKMINDADHQSMYRHTCKLKPCRFMDEDWHTAYFFHTTDNLSPKSQEKSLSPTLPVAEAAAPVVSPQLAAVLRRLSPPQVAGTPQQTLSPVVTLSDAAGVQQPSPTHGMLLQRRMPAPAHSAPVSTSTSPSVTAPLQPAAAVRLAAEQRRQQLQIAKTLARGRARLGCKAFCETITLGELADPPKDAQLAKRQSGSSSSCGAPSLMPDSAGRSPSPSTGVPSGPASLGSPVRPAAAGGKEPGAAVNPVVAAALTGAARELDAAAQAAGEAAEAPAAAAEMAPQQDQLAPFANCSDGSPALPQLLSPVTPADTPAAAVPGAPRPSELSPLQVPGVRDPSNQHQPVKALSPQSSSQDPTPPASAPSPALPHVSPPTAEAPAPGVAATESSVVPCSDADSGGSTAPPPGAAPSPGMTAGVCKHELTAESAPAPPSAPPSAPHGPSPGCLSRESPSRPSSGRGSTASHAQSGSSSSPKGVDAEMETPPMPTVAGAAAIIVAALLATGAQLSPAGALATALACYCVVAVGWQLLPPRYAVMIAQATPSLPPQRTPAHAAHSRKHGTGRGRAGRQEAAAAAAQRRAMNSSSLAAQDVVMGKPGSALSENLLGQPAMSPPKPARSVPPAARALPFAGGGKPDLSTPVQDPLPAPHGPGSQRGGAQGNPGDGEESTLPPTLLDGITDAVLSPQQSERGGRRGPSSSSPRRADVASPGGPPGNRSPVPEALRPS